ncbi:NADH:ubiquinone oxidoreductase [Mycobacterium sp. M23085]|uniref:NADH-quinone oxidoreductase subunit B family protein n=1 Tax=Mycobacterium sp. M23085 TaxID=3378087 RepID=UPI003877918B
MVVFFRGLRDGLLTTRWPKHSDTYFDEFPAAIEVLSHDRRVGHRVPLRQAVDAAAGCPTAAIAVADMPKLDRGKCILCGRCVATAPDWFRWAPGADTSRLQRDALVVSPVPETDEALDRVRAELAKRVRRLRRSVHLRHVDAGSDGSDEWEVQALLNPVYDLHRLGIFFTASPRHADILLVTGVGAVGMTEPLRRTLEGMPRPTVVIAVGTDAISGGLVGGGYTGGTGIGDLLPVDVWIPGSPASPFSLLHGILLALGRLPGASRRTS